MCMRNLRFQDTQTSHESPVGLPMRLTSVAGMLAIVGVLGCGGGDGRSQKADAGDSDGLSSTVGCIGEGGTLIAAAGEACCPGLTTVACAIQVAIPDASPGTAACASATYQCSICVQGCGDGKCTLGENVCNCGEDCDPAANQPGCHPDNVPFDTPSNFQGQPVSPYVGGDGEGNAICCGFGSSGSEVFAYDDNCGETLAYPTQLICLSHCGDGKCEGMETPCSCPWDCLTDTAGCYREGYTYNPGTNPLAAIKNPGGCCPGLTAVRKGQPAVEGTCYFEVFGELMCLRCGDGVCTVGENICNCPRDCH